VAEIPATIEKYSKNSANPAEVNKMSLYGHYLKDIYAIFVAVLFFLGHADILREILVCI
jgi:hypothetical protein